MLYESRLEKEDLKTNYPTYPQLAWRGQEDIRGKKILIHSEQGLGDSIQFIRYLEQIHQLGAEIILEVPKTLATLVNTIKTPITVIEKGSKLPEFDAYCPLLSLPYVFKTTVDTIPSVVPYLFADKKKVSKWNHRLGVKTRKRIGLVWSGSTVHKNDHNRSIPLEIFTDLLKLPVEWHSLQNEYRTKDKNFLDSHPEIRQHQEELGDFADTAALIECMDLVISVDTSVAHLAGALGKTTWILLPFIPDFRWMLEREDCPWYPTVKLLRQDEERDWKKVITKLMREL
jgi:ADP-heptose:LPS heptosyltransferase